MLCQLATSALIVKLTATALMFANGNPQETYGPHTRIPFTYNGTCSQQMLVFGLHNRCVA